MDDKLDIPNPLHKAIKNRLEYYQHGKSNVCGGKEYLVSIYPQKYSINPGKLPGVRTRW